MRQLVVALALALAVTAGGCVHTASKAPAPSAKAVTTPPPKPSPKEIEAKVAQELKELGAGTSAQHTEEQKPKAAQGRVTYDIPITINREVERFIDYFQTKIPGRFRRWLERSGRYIPMMRAILRSHGLPEDLVYLALIESGFSCNAYSRAHAVGPWQFIRSTARRYGLRVDYWVDERRDPVKSTHAAARYLKDLYQEFGSWYLAAAAYNAGEAKIRKALRRANADDFWDISHGRRRYLKRETRQYVPKMIAAALIAKEPEKYGFTNLKYDPPLSYDEVTVEGGTSLAVAAKLAGTTTKVIAQLNPALRRWCTPPHRSYRLRIPKGTKARFLSAYAKLSPRERRARIGVVVVRVRRGDTLGRIARRYGVSLRDLLALNPRVRPRRLRIGQRILIPPTSWRARRLAHHRRSRRGLARRVAPPPGAMAYVVRPGDSLWKIARAHGVSVRRLRRCNRLYSSRLKPGQKIWICPGPRLARASRPHPGSRPAPEGMRKVVHVVRPGDSLWEIGRAYGVSYRQIKRWNRLRTTRLKPGQKLVIYIPGRQASTGEITLAAAKAR